MTAVLAVTGPVILYSASAVRSQLVFGSSAVYLGRQLQGLVAGLLIAAAVARIPGVWIRRTGIVVFALSILLLACTLSPLGVERNGARRWLAVGVGGLGVVVQPLELVKLGLVVALAQWLSAIGERVRDFRLGVAIPLAGVCVPCALLLLQPDFGAAVLLGLFALAMLFAAGARPSHLLAVGVALSPIVVGLAFLAEYRVARLQGFFDPFDDPSGRGYQLIQSLLAFGAGGLFGTGLGAGQQKLGYLPEAHTDFILSVVGEELGLVGTVALFGALALFGAATLGIATRARDRYELILATGAGLLIWLQGMLNAAVTMGLLPTTGTTLPFLSYGRSSLVVSLVAVGLVANVARAKHGRVGWR